MSFFRENVGWKSFFETAQDPDTCKIACVSALINLEKIQNFLFRNYTYPPGVASVYPGSMKKTLWEAVRASSAAPTYYEEFKLGEFVHQVKRSFTSVFSTAPLPSYILVLQ